MAESFGAINEQVNAALEGTSQSNNESDNKSQSLESTSSDRSSETREATSQAQKDMLELERVEKFRFQGKEYTSKELGTLLAREKEAQKGFTQKMQALSEERKAFETQRSEYQKYNDNLVYDLEKVRKDPSLAQEFIRTYPEPYHRHLRAVLSNTSEGQASNTGRGQQDVPVELMSQVQRLQEFVQKQEVAKAEVQIEHDLNKALSQFKYASKKEVLADIYEFHNQSPADPLTGAKAPITLDLWMKAAEASHNDRMESYKSYQKELINNQKQANSKARDVGAGGGVPGQGPKKFKSFKELNQHVLSHVTRDQ